MRSYLNIRHKLKLLHALAFGLALLTPRAFADRSFDDQFIQCALQIPVALQKLGYRDFGSLNLNQLEQDIRRSHAAKENGWKVADANERVGDEGRISGHCERRSDGTHAQIDSDQWKNKILQRPQLCLHEVFCVRDHDYWLTSHMKALTFPEVNSYLTAGEREKISQRIGRLYAMSGGVIGVGGGGESSTLYVRDRRIQRDLKALASAPPGSEDHPQAAAEFFDDLIGHVTVSYTHWTPKKIKEAERKAKQPIRTACLMPNDHFCPLPPQPIATFQNCRCPGHPEEGEGFIVYPH
jgi:hypothetical protein